MKRNHGMIIKLHSIHRTTTAGGQMIIMVGRRLELTEGLLREYGDPVDSIKIIIRKGDIRNDKSF